MGRIFDTVLDRCRTDRTTSIGTLVQEELKNDKLDDPTYITLWYVADLTLRAEGRLNLLRSLKDFRVDIFGKGSDLKLFDALPNLHIHDPVPFQEALTIMRQSKVILNSSPQFRSGAHERIFTAMAVGSIAVTDTNPYLTSCFTDNDDLLLYDPDDLTSLPDRIHSLLTNQDAYNILTTSAQKKIAAAHTWDHRA
ncbi:MAG: glycosyltransferase [Chlamydiia bacterium]|nr:glycosyltransferase [Chlamydiia bacterium]